jgi:hypothetical protein
MKGPPRASRTVQLARIGWDFARSIPLAARFRRDFAAIREVCLFVGAPKTGHSLVGALLDAHPRIVIAHEVDVLLLLRFGFRRRQIFALLLDNARRQAARGRGESGYDYVVPGQWQGRFERLAVLGDKHAEGTALRLLLFPQLWRRLERELGRPRFVHVVRNPFDVIASLTRPVKRALDLSAATEYCFHLLSVLPEVRRRAGETHFVELRHEDLVASPRESVARLCGFLGEEAPADYLEACAARVFTAPRRARDGVEWTPARIRDVDERAARLDFLRGYDFVR